MNPEAYRPISLTCIMCKLLEKIVNKRLCWHLQQQHLYAPEQSGFRKERSTNENIIDLESEINEAFLNFDIKRAFDTTWRLNILKQLVIKRTFQVRVNGHLSAESTQTNGAPQGSIISATLFLAAINNVSMNIQAPIKSRIFADDLVFMIKGKSLETMSTLLQSQIDILENRSK